MLPLDHIPVFSDPDTFAVRAFQQLGFTCSPRVEYRSPEYPEATWISHCIFFASNWIDLLQNTPPTGHRGAVLGGCLFRSDNLEEILADVPDQLIHDQYQLLRASAVHKSRPKEHFDIVQLDARHRGISLSLAGHGWPSVDVQPELLVHPNGAQTVLGLHAHVGDPVDAPVPLDALLDVSVITTSNVTEYYSRFGLTDERMVMRIGVDSLSQTLEHLTANDVTIVKQDDEIVVSHPKLRFGVVFSEI